MNIGCDPIHDECYDIQIKLEKQIANNEAIIARYQQALNYFYNGHALVNINFKITRKCFKVRSRIFPFRPIISSLYQLITLLMTLGN